MDDPMTSVQKVHALIAHVEQLDVGVDAGAQGLMLALTMFKPQLLELLPTDPAELDELLLTGARWALGLRSDTADPVGLAVDTGPLLWGDREPPRFRDGAWPAATPGSTSRSDAS